MTTHRSDLKQIQTRDLTHAIPTPFKLITYWVLLLEFPTLISDNRLYQSVIVPGIIYILLFPPLAIAGIAKLCGALVNFSSGQQNLINKNIFKLFQLVFKSQYFSPIWILIYQIWETSRNKLKKHSVTKNSSDLSLFE